MDQRLVVDHINYETFDLFYSGNKTKDNNADEDNSDKESVDLRKYFQSRSRCKHYPNHISKM